jgi:hypothetical protein
MSATREAIEVARRLRRSLSPPEAAMARIAADAPTTALTRGSPPPRRGGGWRAGGAVQRRRRRRQVRYAVGRFQRLGRHFAPAAAIGRRPVESRVKPASSFVKRRQVLSRVVKALLDSVLSNFKDLRPPLVDKRASVKTP